MRAKGTISQNKFLEYQIEMGVGSNDKYHPLLRSGFLPISAFMFDGQEVHFSEGIFTVELACFFERLEAAGISK